MLTQAEQSIKNNEWIAFLGWTPHPVMGAMKITYLDGMGDSGFGAATVFTNVRKGYTTECPNAGKFIANLKFNLDMEGEMMDAILKGGDANTVATDWLKKHADAVTPWIAGVTTFVERRVWARIQSRIGPNRVGPGGSDHQRAALPGSGRHQRRVRRDLQQQRLSGDGQLRRRLAGLRRRRL